MIEKWARKRTTRRRTLGSLSKKTLLDSVFEINGEIQKGVLTPKNPPFDFRLSFRFLRKSRKGFKNCSQEQRFCTRTQKKAAVCENSFANLFRDFPIKLFRKKSMKSDLTYLSQMHLILAWGQILRR